MLFDIWLLQSVRRRIYWTFFSKIICRRIRLIKIFVLCQKLEVNWVRIIIFHVVFERKRKKMCEIQKKKQHDQNNNKKRKCHYICLFVFFYIVHCCIFNLSISNIIWCGHYTSGALGGITIEYHSSPHGRTK